MLLKKVAGRLETALRPRLPESRLDRVVELRVRRALRDERHVATAREELDFLLGCTDLAGDVDALVPTYLRHLRWRGELRWHPELMIQQRVGDVSPALDALGLGRGLLVSFLHHAYYDGIFGALRRHGLATRPVATPTMFDGTAPAWMMAQRRVAELGGPCIDASGGTTAIRAALAAGEAVGVATDVPSRTPLTFLGRERLGASGLARLAHDGDVPVLLVTSHPAAGREEPRVELRLRVLSPADFAGAEELLAEMLRHHEGPVLAWPEAYDQPTKRWGRAPVPDDRDGSP